MSYRLMVEMSMALVYPTESGLSPAVESLFLPRLPLKPAVVANDLKPVSVAKRPFRPQCTTAGILQYLKNETVVQNKADSAGPDAGPGAGGVGDGVGGGDDMQAPQSKRRRTESDSEPFAAPQSESHGLARTRAKPKTVTGVQEEVAAELEKKRWAQLEEWHPDFPSNAQCTLLVSRLAYETTDRKLRREFEAFGVVKSVAVVHHSATGKPKGYGFVEYVDDRDAKRAYSMANGMEIDGRRVVVDIERGRLFRGYFLPRRMGGGLGKTRASRPPKQPT
eukprot:ANDGO_00778.mRNA.1 U1 small nuclear ribonucleoprotein 70 kDa